MRCGNFGSRHAGSIRRRDIGKGGKLDLFTRTNALETAR